MEKLSGDEKIRRGQEAQQLLGNPMLTTALDAVKEAAHRAIDRSEPDDREGRERCYYMVQAVDRLFQQLRSYVASGKIEVAANESESHGSRQPLN